MPAESQQPDLGRSAGRPASRRRPVDRERVSERVSGKVVLVTGAQGRRLGALPADCGFSAAVVGFIRPRRRLYLEREAAGKFPSLAFEPRIGSITGRQ